MVMDKVATSRGIRSGVEFALGGCMTSNSEARDVFIRQYGFGAVAEDCRKI